MTAKLPDALSGGAFTGLRNGPIVLTQTDALPAERAVPAISKHHVGNCYVLGGPVSVAGTTETQIRNSLIP